MNIYSYLKKDHQRVASLMNQLLATKSKNERAELFEEITYELLLHTKTEEDTFYKALENKKPAEENLKEVESEHKEIEKYLKKLSTLEFNSAEWIEQFGEFKHCVTHHVHEEEGVIFEKAKKVLSNEKAEQLAVEMEKLKQMPEYQKKADI